MSIDFKNSFTVGFCNKSAAGPVLYSPLHLKYVTTLPCKTSAAATFDFQQVTHGVFGRVQVWEHEPDIR